jgi:hypothetical protein
MPVAWWMAGPKLGEREAAAALLDCAAALARRGPG